VSEPVHNALNVVVIGKQAMNWFDAMQKAYPSVRFGTPDTWSDPLTVQAAVVSEPNALSLRPYENLQFVQSLWMGVDALVADPTLPANVRIARMVDPDMPISMAETVAAYVLWSHRFGDVFQRNQRDQIWQEIAQPLARRRTVGLLGLGTLGSQCARVLIQLGFQVVGWSRTAKPLSGVQVFDDLHAMLDVSEIVVNMLPLTEQTRGLLCARTFSAMQPGAVLINVGRGAHVIDNDLLEALDSNHLRHAVLDVFNVEPLPTVHRFWTHPSVTVTPHVAADSSQETCMPVVIENLRRFAEGLPLNNLVDRTRGY
jgi:glyoxylate/hydroxypyruvate reductase